MQGWTAMELQEKKHKKDYRIQKDCLEKTYSLLILDLKLLRS